MQVEDGLLDMDNFKAEAKLASRWFEMPVRGVTSHSRVLIVRGPRNMVSQQTIIGFLRESIKFELDEVITSGGGFNVAVLEIRFTSYRGQAELAYQKLTTDPRMATYVVTNFGRDPCDLHG